MPKTAKTQPFYKGRIPADWTVATFGELFEFLKTFSFSRENLTDEKTESGIHYIHYGDIHSKFSAGILDFEAPPEVPYLKNGILNAKILSKTGFSFLKDGDLVIVDASEDYEGIGQCVELKGVNGKKVIAGLPTIAAAPKDKRTIAGYRTYLLQHHSVGKELKRSATGISVLGLSKGNLEKIHIGLPTIAEQKAIASSFSSYDKVIDDTTKLIRAKKDRLEWFRVQCLGGSRKFSKFKDVWKRTKLKDVLDEHCVSSAGKEEVFSVSVHEGLINQIEHLGRSFAAATTDHYNLVKPGDIVYTKSPTGDFPYGIIKQSKVNKNVIVSPLYGVFTPKTRELGVLLDCYFESPANVFNYLHPIVQRGAKNTISITNKRFLSNSLLLPTDVEEQKALAGFVELAKREIRLLERQAEAYRRQKHGLMQKLLTGEWRVKSDRR